MIAGLSVIDLAILVILALGAWRGFRTGALIEVARTLGLVLAFLLAARLMKPAGLLAQSAFGIPEQVAPLAGFLGAFSLVMACVMLAARLLQYVIGKVKLGGANKAMGGLVGAAKGALLASVLLLVLDGVNLPDAKHRSESAFYESVAYIAPAAWDAVSRTFGDVAGHPRMPLRLAPAESKPEAIP